MRRKFTCQIFNAVFCANASIIYTCFILILEFVVIATNTWYIKENAPIKYFHGGLWNECMGTTSITFCSYYKHVPDWLTATQIFILMSLLTIVIHLLYAVVAMARKSLRLSVLFGFNNFTALLFLISLIIYSVNCFTDDVIPSTTFYIACLTFVAQLLSSALTFYAFSLATKLDKKKQMETGIMA